MFTNELSKPLEVLMWFAWIGIIATAGAVVVGIPLLLWWCFNHIRFY